MRYFFSLKKDFFFVLCCFLIFTFCLASMYIPSDADAQIYDNVIRFHVIANSDTEQDQALKLKLRDAVLSEYRQVLESCYEKDDAYNTVSEMLCEIESFCKNYVSNSGYDYDIEAMLDTEYYERTEYKDFVMPRGNYASLRIIIGDGEGKNWWCVLFPPLCTKAAMNTVYEEDFEGAFIEAGFTGEQYRIITETENRKYRIKFRLLELLFGE